MSDGATDFGDKAMADLTGPITVVTTPAPPVDPSVGPFVLALRLGWAMAETRGRYRLWDDAALQATTPVPDSVGHALPLADERSQAEQRVEAQSVLQALSRRAGVDAEDHRRLPNQDGAEGVPATTRLTQLAEALAAAHEAGGNGGENLDVSAAWDAFADFLYSWDAYIQDQVASGPFGTASAYQLGRSLAETFWALDPQAAPDAADSWDFLLGEHRRAEITRLLKRLAGRFDPISTRAVAFALAAWSALGTDPAQRSQPGVRARLLDQIRVWRDLLLVGQDPRSLVNPNDLLGLSRQVRRLVRSFLPELIGVSVGIAALAVAVGVLVSRGQSHTIAAIVAVVAGWGASSAGLAAWAKNLGQGVLSHQRAVLYQDAINQATTLCPAPPKPSKTKA